MSILCETTPLTCWLKGIESSKAKEKLRLAVLLLEIPGQMTVTSSSFICMWNDYLTILHLILFFLLLKNLLYLVAASSDQKTKISLLMSVPKAMRILQWQDFSLLLSVCTMAFLVSTILYLQAFCLGVNRLPDFFFKHCSQHCLFFLCGISSYFLTSRSNKKIAFYALAFSIIFCKFV